ncbi:uncharacterized protein At4g26450-like isoform X2 [Mangifera indica]|uniref:uncharacterized protein At4g26450-like isoform X2 n=1 Tax=Mangifera indica TaxID=29780 RepID=UPI001CFC21F4|nr:uncharacterized protein At4g26450-like isoform X2 [Mangifera indica]
MHARHRNPGNVYRSNSMAMGVPPEGSARGRGFYSEYRSFNRGFGRGQGQPKSFQQPPPMPRKSDVFMEAGRLAAEYLVSQGLLPPTILSGKIQNGTFRSEDGENFQLPHEGRSSVLTRLGNSSSDVGSGRRRYPDDYNSMGLRNYLNRRKKGGSFKSSSSDWGREYGRSGSWSEKGRASPDIGGDCDSYSGNQDEQISKDVGDGLQKPGLGEVAPKSEEFSGLESELEKYNIQDEMGSRASSSSVGKDLMHETDGEFSKKSVDSTNMDVEAGELKDEICNDETKEQDALEESAIKHYSLEDDTSTKTNNDLLAFCRFAKVPTKTRSSLTCKGQKVDSVSNNDVEKTSDTILPGGSEALGENNSLVSSVVDMLPDKTLDSKYHHPEISKPSRVQSVEGVGALGSVYGVEQGHFVRSQSFPDRALICDVDQGLGQGFSDLQKSSSMVQERGGKRTMEENDSVEATKKLREWFPSMVTQSNEYSIIPSMSDKKASSQETAAPCEVSLAVDLENSVNSFQFPRRVGEPCVGYVQEKQLFPGSYKICDLNLMEASDINENHHSDPTLIYPIIPKKEATMVDVDLSMSNSIMSGEYGRRTSDGKEIEIIDLENDSAQTDKALDNSEQKTETMFTVTEGFPNHVQNAGHIPDVQDNYDGLMITQLLNNFPDCPAVPVDINALQNEMTIHNGEGALGDDDSIYMSLGEIPLSMPDI